MKLAVVFGVLSLVGLLNATCTLKETVTVEPSLLAGTWYETYILGDWWMSTFHKCIKNEISIGGDNSISKTRSSKFKWFPLFTLKDQSTLENRGTYWNLNKKTWLGTSTSKFTIVAKDANFLILKSCSGGVFDQETIWIYGKSKDGFTAAQIFTINTTLAAWGEKGLDQFSTVSQTGC